MTRSQLPVFGSWYTKYRPLYNSTFFSFSKVKAYTLEYQTHSFHKQHGCGKGSFQNLPYHLTPLPYLLVPLLMLYPNINTNPAPKKSDFFEINSTKNQRWFQIIHRKFGFCELSFKNITLIKLCDSFLFV